MRKIVLFYLCILGVFIHEASAQKITNLDMSPHDISYYRGKDKKPLIKVLYGRPQKKGREIFGVLEPFGKVWRTGANEATEIKFYKPVKFNGKDVSAGTYSLFTIPEKDQWTIILNSELDQWGAFTYDSKYDVLRTTVPVKPTEKEIEIFTINFKEENGNTFMVLAWDKTMVEIPFKF